MDTNLSPQRYKCIVLDFFKFKISLFKSIQNGALKTAAHHFVVHIRLTACLRVEQYDLFITKNFIISCKFFCFIRYCNEMNTTHNVSLKKNVNILWNIQPKWLRVKAL